MFTIENIKNGDIVHQMSLLIKGFSDNCVVAHTSILVSVSAESERETGGGRKQEWPMSRGCFKALVILNPGKNDIIISNFSVGLITISVNYLPVAQTPPLHLAILVAHDSSERIDFPPCKAGSIADHGTLEAAIKKLRMAATMCQALLAEEMHAAGLGRRSFRLELEDGIDTLRSESMNDTRRSALYRSMIKVHVIRTDKTVAEIRRAEGTPGHNELLEIFTKALETEEDLFGPKGVVAGLVLDSSYDASTDILSGHTAFAKHDPGSRSIGVIGSQLVYTWPRFSEEVANCLLDITGNELNVRTTNWASCAMSQGSFFEKIGHAFGIPLKATFLKLGHWQDWPKHFLPLPPPKGEGLLTADDNVKWEWSLEDKLRLLGERHFAHPSDKKRDRHAPMVYVRGQAGLDQLAVQCRAGIAAAYINGNAIHRMPTSKPLRQLVIRFLTLKHDYEQQEALRLKVLSMNGKHVDLPVWKVVSSQSPVNIPGTEMYLRRINAGHPLTKIDRPWAAMLKKRDDQGQIVRAYKIDLRVDSRFRGIGIYYEDGIKVDCGKRGDRDAPAHVIALPNKGRVCSVEVAYSEPTCFVGMQIHVSNGKATGALNEGASKVTLEMKPNANEEIVGFYGMNGPDGECCQFGILKAPRGVPLPDSLYDKAELQGGSGSDYDPDNDRRGSVLEEESGDVDEADTSDDEVACQSDVPMSWGCDDECEHGDEEAEFVGDNEDDDDGNICFYEYDYDNVRDYE
uniref:Jacalin-type lectin domain-containing protein n=1 Tax=Bionectria ochroleuca TaxID=29856 RepID=A0A8H7NQE5_BIOOC